MTRSHLHKATVIAVVMGGWVFWSSTIHSFGLTTEAPLGSITVGELAWVIGGFYLLYFVSHVGKSLINEF